MDNKEERGAGNPSSNQGQTVKQNTIIRFDAENEEWESIVVNQNAEFYEHSQACMVDDDMILITGGRQTNSSGGKQGEPSDSDEATTICQLYSIPKNQFYSFPPMNLGRFMHMMVSFKDQIYVMGGKTEENENEGITSSVEKIAMAEIKDYIRGGIGGTSEGSQPNNRVGGENTSSPLVKARWSEIEPFNKYRYNAITIVYRREIYLLGGVTRGGKLCRYVEKFNINENHWYTLKWKMPFAIHSCSVTTLSSSEIIIIGGKNDAGLTPSIYQMNFLTRRYQSKGAFSFRLLPKVLNHLGNIYIFGGDKNMSCEKLNPIEFVSFEASESYNTLLNGDLTNFPAGHPTVVLSQEEPMEENQNPFKEQIKLSPLDSDFERFYLFGTPNHPFMLELDTVKESANFHPVSFDLRFYFFGYSLRLNENYIISMGGITPPRKSATRSVQIISTNTGFETKKAAKMKDSRCKFSAICAGDKVFVVGGINFVNEAENYMAACEMYDVNKNTWTKISSLNQNRYNCALGLVGDKIYAFGGSNGQNYLETVECYSISQDTWLLFKLEELKLEEPCSNISVLHMSDHEFLLVGGSTTDKMLRDVVLFDTKNNQQQKVGQLADPRSSSKVFKHNDYIFILGGSKNEKGIEVLKRDNYDLKPDLFKMFDDAMAKCYKDKMLNGIEGA